MALEATHIRFALDLQKKYAPVDIRTYIAGTVYPDSRYVTGVDRHLTHITGDAREKLLSLGDFGKGWHAHLLCDNIQYEVTKELFPETFAEKSGQGSEGWVKHSALKLLQDIDDLSFFAIKDFLPFLDYVHNPNGEDMAVLRAYHETFRKFYSQNRISTFDDYYDMWKLWGVGDELASRMRRYAESYAQDKTVMQNLKKIYPQVISRAL